MNSTPFTIEQIKHAHGKVKSGADFPQYIRDLAALGVTAYTTYVSDGHTRYEGKNGYAVSSRGLDDVLEIADRLQSDKFKEGLTAHQQGKSDYPTFCRLCADCGIEKWIVSVDQLNCTYYDKPGNQVLTEQVPG